MQGELNDRMTVFDGGLTGQLAALDSSLNGG